MPDYSMLENRKFLRLCRDLKTPVPTVWGCLDLLWRNAHITDNPCFETADIEVVSQWPGEDGVFAQTLINTGWLDAYGELWRIHDFEEHAGNSLKNRWNMRKKRTADAHPPQTEEFACVTQCKTVSHTPESVSHSVKQFYTPSHTPESVSHSVKLFDYTRRDEQKRDEIETSQYEANTKPNAPDPPDGNPDPSTPIGVLKALESLQSAIESDGRESLGETVKRAVAVTRAASLWHPWLSETVASLAKAGNGGLSAIEAAIRTLEDAADPVTRRAKDVGEFKEPLKWLVKQITAECKKAGIRWPAFPGGA